MNTNLILLEQLHWFAAMRDLCKFLNLEDQETQQH